MMVVTLVLVVLLCCVEGGCVYRRWFVDKAWRWEGQMVVVRSALREAVWCVRCKESRNAGYRWDLVGYEVSRCLLAFTKGLVNLWARQHNRIQYQ
jgi:hypothetical protein